jgi:hypothetical protein
MDLRVARRHSTLTRAAVRADAHDMSARLRLARKLTAAKQLDEATTEYQWLWEHCLEHRPSFVGVRHSYMVAEIRELASRHPPAKVAFARLRDVAGPGAEDWFRLNEALGETARTLSWFDTVRDKLDADAALARVVERHVIKVLQNAGRWVDAGMAYKDPLDVLTRMIPGEVEQAAERRLLEQLPAEQRTKMMEESKRWTVARLTRLRRSLYEAHRDDELQAVEEAAAKHDPSWVTPRPPFLE